MRNTITQLVGNIEQLENNIKQLEQSNTSIDLQQDRIRNQLLQVNNELEACYSSKNKLANDLADVEEAFKDIEPIIINQCEIEVIPNDKLKMLVDTLNLDNIGM